jgi:hypothetical protein
MLHGMGPWELLFIGAILGALVVVPVLVMVVLFMVLRKK